MKIEFFVYCGSDRASAAVAECERQLAAMRKHYPAMMIEGRISGKDAETRQSAMEDAAAILRLVRDQIRGGEMFSLTPEKGKE